MGGEIRRADSVRDIEVDGSVTLFHPETQTALVLNSTAGAVWRLLDGRHDVEDIVAELTASYDADPATIRAGVDDAVAQLRRHGLLATT